MSEKRDRDLCADSVGQIMIKAVSNVIIIADYGHTYTHTHTHTQYAKSEVWFLWQFETKRTKFCPLSWPRNTSYPCKVHKIPMYKSFKTVLTAELCF